MFSFFAIFITNELPLSLKEPVGEIYSSFANRFFNPNLLAMLSILIRGVFPSPKVKIPRSLEVFIDFIGSYFSSDIFTQINNDLHFSQ